MIVTAMLVLSSVIMQRANGEAANITVSPESVVMRMNLVVQENLTALPLISAQIDSTNSTNIVEPYIWAFKSAIQRAITGGDISSLNFSIKTANVTNSWFLKENYTLVISGVNSNSGSHVTSRLGFVSMNISQPLQISNLEFNEVGPTILLPALQTKAAAYQNLQYYIDGSNPRNAVIPEATTARFSLLDFTWVPPVSTWSRNNNILDQSTIWTIDPTTPHYNLTLGVPSPEGPLLRKFTAIFSPSMSITVPANAWVDGNTVFFDTPTPTENVMFIIAATSLIIAVITFVADRKIAAPFRTRRKR